MLDYKVIEGTKIKELATGLIIHTAKNETAAKQECREFNLGKKGFSGWTPEFLFQKLDA